jgi:ABC-2 type transport system ATP-binding protein
MRQMPAADLGSAAIDVECPVKHYKTARAMASLPHAAASMGCSAATAQQDHYRTMGGAGAADLRRIWRLIRCEQSDAVRGRLISSPYVDKPMRLTVRVNRDLRQAHAVTDARSTQLADDLDLNDFLDRANGSYRPGRRPASRWRKR